MKLASALSICAMGAGMAIGGAAFAQTTITQWNFNSNPGDGNTATGSFSPSFGSGTAGCYNVAPSLPLAECVFAAGTGSSDPDTADDSGWQTRGYPAQGQGPGTVGVEFSVSTVNFNNIVVTWDQRHSNTSSRYTGLFYSIDGVNFIAASNGVFEGPMGDTWFNGRSVDLSSIPGVSNNPNFRFRISSAFDPATGTNYTASNTASTYAGTGTYRFDMVTVSGSAAASIPPQGVAQATPSAVCVGGGQVTLGVMVTPGLNPASLGVAVIADLTSLNGAPNAALLDDGLSGDAAAGDGIYTLVYMVPPAVTTGVKSIPITVSDAQLRSTLTGAQVTVSNCSTNSASRVVISQVYGGGANQGPPVGVYDADFVELHNRSAQVVNLDGWSVQYASAGAVGGFDSAADLVALSGNIQPGQYILVRFSDPGLVGSPLPNPDFIGRGGIGNSAGRVALVRSTSLIGVNCADANIEDLVGWGGALCFEGAASAGPTANDSGVIRKAGGGQDTDQNFNDWTVGTPAPKNRAFGGFLAGYGSVSARAVCAGDAVGLSVSVQPAGNSTGIQVRADLSQLAGSPTQPLTDAGGNLFTLTYQVPTLVSQGGKTIPVTVTDLQGRTDSSVLTVLIGNCTNSGSRVVIAGFFGGGGNAGSPWNADHIELFNRSDTPVDLAGWSVQYANADSAAGFLISQLIPLAGVIAPGEYRLVQTSAPGVNGLTLPTPDFTAVPAFGMDNASGRIALVRVQTALGTDCANPNVEDLIGYGEAAICQEGIATTLDIDNTTGGYRLEGGCQDFDQNAIDLVIEAPLITPRSSATPVNPCAAVPANGACCFGTTCSVTPVAACTGANKRFAGAGTVCNMAGNVVSPCCKADFNQSGAVSVQDIFDFLSAYFNSAPETDLNGVGGSTVQDIFDFLSAYFAGC